MSDRVEVSIDPSDPQRIVYSVTLYHPKWRLIINAADPRAGVVRLMQNDRASRMIAEMHVKPQFVEITVASVMTGAGFDADTTADEKYLLAVFDGAKIESVTDATGRVFGTTGAS